MIRLDKHLLTLYPDFSRSRIEGLIKGGYVTVNGAAAAKAEMKRTGKKGEKVKVYANGDWEPCGEITLKGSNRCRLVGARNCNSY